jgi:hypothetical protein
MYYYILQKKKALCLVVSVVQIIEMLWIFVLLAKVVWVLV